MGNILRRSFSIIGGIVQFSTNIDLFGNKSLPPLGARTDTITSSGMSSGSMMSNNLHVIFSRTIKGVGLMMGTSYWTPDVMLGGENRLLFDSKDVFTLTQESIDKAEEYQASREIDSLSNLEGAPVYILSGLNDQSCLPRFQES